LQAKTPTRFTVNAQGGQNLQYQFFVDGVKATDYSPSNTFDWVPSIPKTYKITVWVKDRDSERPYDASSEVNYIVTPIPTTMFDEDFESGGFTTGNWINTGSTVTSNLPNTGAYCAELNDTDSLVKSISGTGFGGIRVKYALKTQTTGTEKHLITEWSKDGTNWTLVDDVSGNTEWSNKSFDLPADADNTSDIKLRFRTNGYTANDSAFIDDVNISALYTAPVVTSDAQVQNIISTGGFIRRNVSTGDPYAILERGVLSIQKALTFHQFPN
jgi:hypothetical protein